MSFPKYEAYKDSGVEWLGEVPEHWTVCRSKTVFAERNTKATENDEQLTASQKYGVIPQKLFSELEDHQVMQVIVGRSILKKAEVNDFVISMRSFQGGLEFCPYSGAISSAYVPLYAKKAIDNSFFKYLFKSNHFISALQQTSNLVRDGQALRYGNFTLLSIPFPSIPEQENIGAFLDHETARIDALIAEQQQLIELLKEKRQAVISHAVTKGLDPTVKMKDSGVEWLGEVPEHWKVISLRHSLQCIEQGWSPECSNTPADLNEWGVLKAGAVNYGIYREEENKTLPTTLNPRLNLEVCNGDLLMCRASGSPEIIGSVAYIIKTRPKLMFSDKLFRFIVNKEVMPEFMSLLLGSLPLRRQIEQSINGAEGLANNLSQAAIKALKISLPPVNEQIQITKYAQSQQAVLENLVATAETTVVLLHERRSALISAAVTGKIDVRDWQVPISA